ncbi:MAG: tRNA epoxyqueuosine(34) reductase QueG [Armatimonadota bacterium]
MEPMMLKQHAISWAIEAGFCVAGVADITPGDELTKLESWLELGYHAEMAYMQSPHRGDIEYHFPWAKSALVVGVVAGEPLQHSNDHYTAARYAQGADYHTVISTRLESLAVKLKDCGIELWKVCVDIQPILERELARRAGLGWIGKNSMLINPLYGSHLLLGVLLLDQRLPCDQPIKQQCGRCERCLQTCPNHALVEPYVLDARRCLSYLTLENKKSIDGKLWPTGHMMLFGCDLCQDCCPYNTPTKSYPARGASSGVDEFVGLVSEWSQSEMIEMLETGSEWMIRQSRALDRVKRVQIIRNVTVAACANHTADSRLQELVLTEYADAQTDQDSAVLFDLVMLLADSVQ